MQTTPIEDLLKLIWIRHLYTNPTLTTSNGGIVRVISPGSINPSAGVDILDARIEIDGKIHHGPIAVHQKPLNGVNTCTTSTPHTTTAFCISFKWMMPLFAVWMVLSFRH